MFSISVDRSEEARETLMAKLTQLQKSRRELTQLQKSRRDRELELERIHEETRILLDEFGEAKASKHLDDVLWNLIVLARDVNQLALDVRLYRDCIRDQQEMELLRAKENSDSGS